MVFPELSLIEDISLLLTRVIVGIIFISSGWSHFTQPAERSNSIGMSKAFTFLLGLGEFFGGLFLILGIWVQLASILLILVMLGAITFKIFKWKIGFYSSESLGWHYDFLILSVCLVNLATAGGEFVIV